MTALTRPGQETAADGRVSSTGETVAPVPYSVSGATGPLSRDELALIDAWWRAANYLAVGQIYLRANPLLTRAAARPSTSSPGCSGTSAPCPA